MWRTEMELIEDKQELKKLQQKYVFVQKNEQGVQTTIIKGAYESKDAAV